ncbi:MAG: cation transporter [Oscillospiraceae bacterium]
MKTQKVEKRILWLSLGAGVFFVLCEFAMAIYSKSQSCLMDAAYDSSEMVVIVLTLFLTPLYHKPISEKRPFGYSQIESIFVIIKGFMLLAVTIGLSANSIGIALSGGNHVDGTLISVFQLVLGLGSLVVLLIMRHMNKHISSPTITTEIYGWKIDVFYSLGMSLAFFGSVFLKNTPLAPILPYFDQIVAVAVIFFMMPEAVKMIWRSIRDVFLFAPEQETMVKIKELCEQVLAEFDYQSTFFYVTRTGRRLWVSVYFKTAEDVLDLETLGAANEKLEQVLSAEFDDCTSELIATAE